MKTRNWLLAATLIAGGLGVAAARNAAPGPAPRPPGLVAPPPGGPAAKL